MMADTIFANAAVRVGCPMDQRFNLVRAESWLQEHQLAACAAARLCDPPSGDWDIAAGQYFTTFRCEVHAIEDFDDTRAREWFAAFDCGFVHYTVALLGCRGGDGNIFIVDEHVERLWLPQRHAGGIKAMLARHKMGDRRLGLSDLRRFVAGADVFSRQGGRVDRRAAICPARDPPETGEHGSAEGMGRGSAGVWGPRE